MKKTYYLLLVMLTLSAAAKAQTDWITKNVDEKLSVKFPAEPQTVTRNGIASYLAKGNDSVKYSTTVLDYKVIAHLDSAALASVKDKQQFADGLRAGIASKKTNYTFGVATVGKWKTYTTYSMSASDNTTKGTLFMYMILIGSKMYTLSCLVPANLATKNNQIFFDSAEVLK